MNREYRNHKQPDVCIIGAGRVGRSLGGYFLKKGITVSGYFSKTYAHAVEAAEQLRCRAFNNIQQAAHSDIIIIAAPDNKIADVATSLCRTDGVEWKDKTVCHLSGAHSSDLLSDLYNKGAAVASLHPPYTFNSVSTIIPEITFVLEGQNINEFKHFLTSKKINYIEIQPDKKMLYHIAAVFSSNYITTLLCVGNDMLKEIGLECRGEIFSHLIKAAVENTINKGAAALTGPIARGDFNTVSAHVEHLKKYNNNWLELYNQLAQHTMKLI